MPQCAGCGKKVTVDEEPTVTLNKTWHKCCFRCYKCDSELDADFARVYKGDIYCHTCFKLFRKYCSFEGEDENVKIEEKNGHFINPICHCYNNTSSSNNCNCKSSPDQTDDYYSFFKTKKRSRKGSTTLPRELANYFNRNPAIVDKRSCYMKDNPLPFVYPLYRYDGQSRSRSSSYRNRKLSLANSVSRSSSCIHRAAECLTGFKKREQLFTTDSCESLENKPHCKNKMHCDVNKRHKYTGCSICRRCGHKVYAAEIVLTSSGAYHNSCFSCYCCLKPLDATNVEEHSGEIFCRRCYKKRFAPNNYGFRNRII